MVIFHSFLYVYQRVPRWSKMIHASSKMSITEVPMSVSEEGQQRQAMQPCSQPCTWSQNVTKLMPFGPLLRKYQISKLRDELEKETASCRWPQAEKMGLVQLVWTSDFEDVLSMSWILGPGFAKRLCPLHTHMEMTFHASTWTLDNIVSNDSFPT